jgi:hypothetical protein
MARCPHCHKILSDAWVKREGASLMGKARSGRAKARSHEQAAGAALLRWDQEGRKRKKD